VERDGFKLYDISGVAVGAGDRVRVDAKMALGNVTETVKVHGDTLPLLQTDSPTVQDVVPEQAVQDLPLNGRNLASVGLTTNVLASRSLPMANPICPTTSSSTDSTTMSASRVSVVSGHRSMPSAKSVC
jgi:hypothetical protein